MQGESSVLTGLTPGFSGSIHSHLDGFLVNTNLRWIGSNGDGKIKILSWKKKDLDVFFSVIYEKITD